MPDDPLARDLLKVSASASASVTFARCGDRDIVVDQRFSAPFSVRQRAAACGSVRQRAAVWRLDFARVVGGAAMFTVTSS